MPFPPIRTALVLACVLACAVAAPARAAELTPSWGYAYIDDRPFQEPSGAFLPTTQAFPRGYIRDTVVDGKDVRMRVLAFDPNGDKVAEYTVDEGDFVNVPIDSRIDVAPKVFNYMRFDFCVFNSSGISCLPSHYIGRPTPPTPPTGGGGNPPPPPGVVDADRDGHQPPADCDDTNSTIHPGAPERAANGLDDDCAGGDLPGRVTASIVNSWRVKDGRTIVRRLGVREAPAGAIAEVRCHGERCPWEKRSKATGARGGARLGHWFKRGLRAGTVIEVRVTAPNAVGKVARYRLRRTKLPRVHRLCLPPGARRPGPC